MISKDLNEFLDKVNRVQKDADKAGSVADAVEDAENHKVRDGKTRSTLTLTFMIGFFGILVFSCLFVLIYNWAAVHWVISLKQSGLVTESSEIKLLEVDKILSIMIGALGTSLGFIIGYYFKEKHT